MYSTFLHAHSLLRYFVLIALVVVIVNSLRGMTGNKSFGKWDNKLSLYLLIFTHLQFVVGLILYFVSPWVKFGAGTMSDKLTRYWTVEHVFGMAIAIVLITVARITSKKMALDRDKHKRLFMFNLIALLIIIVVVILSGRGLLNSTAL
jgi:hypothetical protein